MEYIYSAMLLHSAKKEITEENITKILKAVDIPVDEARVKALVASLEDIDIDEAINTAVAAPVAMAGSGAAPASPAAEEKGEKKEEKKKEEEEEEVSEDEAVAGLGALFG